MFAIPTLQMACVTSPARDDGLLHHRPFALFWSARICTSFAYQMQSVAIGWRVYELTGSPFDLGLVGLAQFMPVLLLTLLVGHVADRYDRRRIVAICQVTEAVAALALAIGTLTGVLGVPGIFAIVALIGAARAFESPTLSALMPGLVGEARSAAGQRVVRLRQPDRQHHRPGVRRPALCVRCGHTVRRSPPCLVRRRQPAGQPNPPGPPGAHARAGHAPLRVLRPGLHPCQPGGAGRDLARPVRRAARRGNGPAAGLCARHPAHRLLGPRPVARGPGGGGAGDVRAAGPATAAAACRAGDVRRRDRVRRRHGRVRGLPLAAAVHPRPGDAWAPPTW